MPEQLSPEVIDQTADVTLADVTDQDALLAELASLSPIDYDQQRESAAKLLGVRMSTLDAAVAAQRSKLEEQHVTAQRDAATPEPWPEAVEGASLLEDLASLFTRYVVLPQGAADMLALWTLHTYTIDAFVITPRLAVVSPQKRCGKTTVMELIDAAACNTLSAANISTVALFRAIEQWRPTMLIDEADTFLPDNEELRGVLNAGYRRPTAYVVRNVPVGDSWEPRKFGVFGPVAIAMIGKLPSTLADRSIHLRLRRKAKREQVERLRLDRIGDSTAGVKRRCLRWAQDHLAQLKASDPAVPETLNDRAADNWRPLCAIAEVAGGEWPERPDSPAMRLRAHAEWRLFLEWPRGARHLGEGQIAHRPVRFVARIGELRFDDESSIGGRRTSPGNIRTLGKAGQDRTVRRINEHCRWRWRFRSVANDAAVKGAQEERIGVDALSALDLRHLGVGLQVKDAPVSPLVTEDEDHMAHTVEVVPRRDHG